MTMFWTIFKSIGLPIFGFILKLMFKKKESKEQALIKFQKWIEERKEYSKRAASISDDYMKQLEDFVEPKESDDDTSRGPDKK